MGEMAFPIHPCHRHMLANVPFAMVERYRARCVKNHGQTPERLAERGGLSLDELAAVLQDSDRFDGHPVDALKLIRERMTQGR